MAFDFWRSDPITRVWPTTSSADFPEKEIEEVESKPAVGVAFSGGGTRSAAATYGQLRALHDLGLLRPLKYLSCNSGGTWGALPYIFSDQPDADYFAADRIPTAEATPQRLGTQPGVDAFLHRLTRAEVLRQRFGVSGDEGFSRIMGSILLRNLRDTDTNLEQPDRSFTYGAADLAAIADRNGIAPGSPEFARLQEQFFTVPQTAGSTPGAKPYLIVSAAQYTGAPRKPAVGRGNSRHRPRQPFPRSTAADLLSHIEFTPRYAGIRTQHPRSRHFRRDPVGGGYVESFAFDSALLARDDVAAPTARVRIEDPARPATGRPPEYVTALSDVVGTSGAAPAQWVDRIHRLTRFLAFPLTFGAAGVFVRVLRLFSDVFPRFRHWSVGDVRARTLTFASGDGGPVTDLALHSLLARRVSHAVAFMNVQTEFEAAWATDAAGPRRLARFRVDQDFAVLFSCDPHGRELRDRTLQVFPRADLAPLVAALQERLEAGLPLVVEAEHRVEPNAFFGIRGGDTVRVLWVYLFEARPVVADGTVVTPRTELSRYYRGLPEETRRVLDGETLRWTDPDTGAEEVCRAADLEHFPNLRTFFIRRGGLIDMSPPQAHLLAHYTGWVATTPDPGEGESRVAGFLRRALAAAGADAPDAGV